MGMGMGVGVGVGLGLGVSLGLSLEEWRPWGTGARATPRMPGVIRTAD